VKVIQHEPDVFGDIPVKPGGVDGLLAAKGGIREAQPIVEIDHAVAGRDFKGAPVVALQGPRMGRYDSVISPGGRIILYVRVSPVIVQPASM